MSIDDATTMPLCNGHDNTLADTNMNAAVSTSEGGAGGEAMEQDGEELVSPATPPQQPHPMETDGRPTNGTPEGSTGSPEGGAYNCMKCNGFNCLNCKHDEKYKMQEYFHFLPKTIWHDCLN